MATKKYTLRPWTRLTKKEKEMLEALKDREIVYDGDSPRLTPEQLAQFRRVSEINREERRRKNVTLRLRPQTIEKARALGKGYSGILSRIVEGVLDDPALLKKFL